MRIKNGPEGPFFMRRVRPLRELLGVKGEELTFLLFTGCKAADVICRAATGLSALDQCPPAAAPAFAENGGRAIHITMISAKKIQPSTRKTSLKEI